MHIVRLSAEYFAVKNSRGRVLFTGTERECHQYCQDVVAHATMVDY